MISFSSLRWGEAGLEALHLLGVLAQITIAHLGTEA